MPKRALALKVSVDTLRWSVAATSLLVLGACWNSKDQFRKYVDEGRANNAPIVVYAFTANDPTNYTPASLGFAFVNTQAAPIDSVELDISVCNTMGQATRPLTFKLGGPFDPNTSYGIAPMGPADAKGHQEHVTIPHAVVMAITVVDVGGRHRFEGPQLSGLLDSKIANYCIAKAM